MVLVDSLQKLLKKTYLGLEGETRFLEGTWTRSLIFN
jgi:hypothetical protein